MIDKIIKFFLDHSIVTVCLIALIVGWGVNVTPFAKFETFDLIDKVSVDAIPDIGENQQIVYTSWPGQSPQDIEDQITYPLTTSLLGIPGVKSIRSSSIFGASNIYIIFDEDVEFYWSRSRVLEKLNSLTPDLLPNNVQPVLGPDATALGQVFWYTIEGLDENGRATGGWDLHEIRSVQDFFVKYNLGSVAGVSEVSSIGGFVKEYQIEVDPIAMNNFGITLHQVMQAVQKSNQDTGAKTVEINRAEYLIRGIGKIKNIEDLESVVLKIYKNTPITIQDIAHVQIGPANRRGVLDKAGTEVVGGVVVVRHGANPMNVLKELKQKINEIANSLPTKKLANGKQSQLTIVPFYDRSQLIEESLGTLSEALSLEVLITVLVIIFLLFNLRASVLISSILPLSVFMVFISMKYFKVDANIVALSGIAIAIGTMVDLGIIIAENIIGKLGGGKNILNKNLNSLQLKSIIFESTKEVATPLITAVSTTIISFIPVFTLYAAEGKLFRPLAFTKTFALISALIVALFVLPTIAYFIFRIRINNKIIRQIVNGTLLVLGSILVFYFKQIEGFFVILFSLGDSISGWLLKINQIFRYTKEMLLGAFFFVYLADAWLPLGPSFSSLSNFIFVLIFVGSILIFFILLVKNYETILRFVLKYSYLFLVLPLGSLVCGFLIFKNTGKEFMPSLDEGSFLLMPTTMPHAGLEQSTENLKQLDFAVSKIPEVETVVGKLGRVNSALDPAPINMFENIINYKPEYVLDENGDRQKFKVNESGAFILKNGIEINNEEALNNYVKPDDLIIDAKGRYFRNWRKHIRNSNDIWKEIVKISTVAGLTSAPKLQPIETRLVMLQTGMRAPMGVKVYGPDLETIQSFSKTLEKILKTVAGVKEETVFADEAIGKPYLNLTINREATKRYNLSIQEVQENIETAIGGKRLSTSIEGRERYNITVRYPRAFRQDIESIQNLILTTKGNQKIKLSDIVTVEYEKGPQMIKSEETFLVNYVLFDKQESFAPVTVIENAKQQLEEMIENGSLIVPNGVTYKFSGSYENQMRAEKTLSVVVPIVLILVFMILYFQFKSVSTSLIIFSGIALAFSGGFIMIWLYSENWFMNINIYEINLRDLLQIEPINLSVAVWVGFIALFGIATDDGVLIGSQLRTVFQEKDPQTKEDIIEATIVAGKKRIKPAVMTTVTTVIALLPILTSTGRGSDIMIPMAIPSIGGMMVATISYFLIPVLYTKRAMYQLKFKKVKSKN